MANQRNLKATLIELLQNKHLLNVAQILEELETQGRSYNKTSVYRALDQLLEENLICKHFFTEAQAAYELREHHHAHLICEKCGKIITAECLYHQPEKVGNFKVNHHHLTLIGICDDCQV
jgi:Fe2+ or Zn2+ uptake regulation protein